MKKYLAGIAVLAGGLMIAQTARAEEIWVTSLDDNTGATSTVGKELGLGKSDAAAWINANGGINGKMIRYEAVDYAYKAPRAVAQYKKWMSGADKPAVMFGYGTADTEALVKFVTRDEIIYFSHSFSAKLTDPVGKFSGRSTPYNFFYGPTYSDGCRAIVQWAADDWKKKGNSAKPKWVHMGANHPYPNSPKAACLAYAKQLGFEVLPDIQYSLRPGDFKGQCLTLQTSGANYAYLANSAGSNIALLKSCTTVGVKVQYSTNIYGMDERVMAAIGAGADGIVVPLAVAPSSETSVPGMALIKKIAGDRELITPHYIRAVCGMLLLREALVWADKNGGISTANIKNAMYQKKDWVAEGLDGVCLPSAYTATDHRGVDQVSLYKTSNANNEASWTYLYTAKLPRIDEWFGK